MNKNLALAGVLALGVSWLDTPLFAAFAFSFCPRFVYHIQTMDNGDFFFTLKIDRSNYSRTKSAT